MYKLIIMIICLGLCLCFSEAYAIDCDDMETEQLRLENTVKEMNERLMADPTDGGARATLLDTIKRLKKQTDDLMECNNQDGNVWEQLTKDILCAMTQGYGSSCPKPIRDICDEWTTKQDSDGHWIRESVCGEVRYISRFSPDQCTGDFIWSDEKGRYHAANECIKECQEEKWTFWPTTKYGEVWMAKFQECAPDNSVIYGNKKRVKIASWILLIGLPVILLAMLFLLIRKHVKPKMIFWLLILYLVFLGPVWYFCYFLNFVSKY